MKNIGTTIKVIKNNFLGAIALNILLSYALLATCRMIFVLTNYELYSTAFENNSLWQMAKGALLFDTSTVCYLNIGYLVVLLFPLHYKEGKVADAVAKWIFIVPNTVGTVANLCDCVYVPFTGRRTTWNVFSEFGNEENMGSIIGNEIINHWWLVLVGILVIWLTYKLYTPAKRDKMRVKKYYMQQVCTLVAIAPLLVFGMRGGIGKAVRPITISNANQYVSSPGDAAIILNTPFSIIRTIGKKAFVEKNYFTNEELESIFTPVQHIKGATEKNRRNVVIFIVESFGKEYIGAYNPRSNGSLTPFLDSLITKSRSYIYSYGNGRKSIDGMPSVLSGIPMFVEPFFLTPASLNNVSGIAGELKKEGYSSAFFHGAPNGSMGFQAFANATGFEKYYGMDEFCTSTKHRGMDDHDGTWAIWDEPFLQYYAECMNELQEPFVTSVFTASSHHPFKIPDEYKEIYTEKEDPFLKCVQYTDHALSRFFEYAKGQSWYENTLFVITADHTNQSTHEEYKTDLGVFEVPIIFYTPDGSLPAIVREDVIAQQIDIMPTVLSYLGRTDAFMAFGNDLLTTPANETFAVNYNNGIYQLVMGDYLLQFDGNNTRAIYNFKHDRLLKENLLGKVTQQPEMEHFLKAIIQQYMQRMNTDNLVVR